MGAVDQAVPLTTAKAHLAGLVQAAETGEVVHISPHGKTVAVLISEQAYATLQGHQSRRDVWTAIADWRAVQLLMGHSWVHHFHGAMQAGSPRRSGVGSEQGGAQLFGQGDAERVVGGEIATQFPCPRP